MPAGIQDDAVEGESAFEQDERKTAQRRQRQRSPARQRVARRLQSRQRFSPDILPVKSFRHRQKRGGKLDVPRQQNLFKPFAAVLYLQWPSLSVAAAKRAGTRRPARLTAAGEIVYPRALHISYREYILATGWLLSLFGPATVAFAVPIFEHRALVVRHWAALAVGMVAGSLPR